MYTIKNSTDVLAILENYLKLECFFPEKCFVVANLLNCLLHAFTFNEAQLVIYTHMHRVHKNTNTHTLTLTNAYFLPITQPRTHFHSSSFHHLLADTRTITHTYLLSHTHSSYLCVTLFEFNIFLYVSGFLSPSFFLSVSSSTTLSSTTQLRNLRPVIIAEAAKLEEVAKTKVQKHLRKKIKQYDLSINF